MIRTRTIQNSVGSEQCSVVYALGLFFLTFLQNKLGSQFVKSQIIQIEDEKDYPTTRHMYTISRAWSKTWEGTIKCSYEFKKIVFVQTSNSILMNLINFVSPTRMEVQICLRLPIETVWISNSLIWKLIS